MSIKDADLLDLVSTTLNDLPKQTFEVNWTNQDYEFCRIYQKERMVIDGGTQIERRVAFDPLGNAKYRRMYETDEPKVGNILKTIKVPWVKLSTDYSWDKFEILQNKNSAKGFINLMTVKRLEGLWSLADLIEERAWKTPTSATDDLYPYGVPYYLNMFNASGVINSSAGFLGTTIVYQDATTGTTCAGIDAATEAKWRNYCAVYTAVDNAMLKAFRIAFMSTRFKAPLFVNDPSDKRTAQKRIYASMDTIADAMDLADKKDDNHSGKEVLGNLRVDDGGLCTINRLPVIHIPQLDGASYSPFYCVDFAKFIPVVHDGYWMEESEPMSDRSQHTTVTVFLDGAHNNLCINRKQAGFVFHKSA
ncbi:MAG: hypothetical protein IMZ53_02900 [Thermoplasmata archaeon]|nr:hypothetical protein [Thermoplasmata archaeon]